MSSLVFCTQCGTRGDAQAAFCDSCGERMRQLAAPPPSAPAPSAPAGVSRGGSPKMLVGAAAALAVLAVGSGVFFIMNRPPDATASALLAAAKAGYGSSFTAPVRRELCRADLDYGKDQFLVDEWDRNTQGALQPFVMSGLYGAPERVQNGGMFGQIVLQYTATPELAKYRMGQQLCLAKDVEIAEVTDVSVPSEQQYGLGKVTTVRGTLVLRSVDTAPWLENAQVRDALLAELSGWEYKDHALQKRVPESFGVRGAKWTTGPAYKADLDAQELSNSRRVTGAGEASTSGVGLLAKIRGMFYGFGPHPLQGRWRMAGNSFVGVQVPEGLSPDITFRSDRVEMGGNSMPAKFEVNGNKVRVTVDGMAGASVFVVDGSDVIHDEGTGLQYRRVK